MAWGMGVTMCQQDVVWKHWVEQSVIMRPMERLSSPASSGRKTGLNLVYQACYDSATLSSQELLGSKDVGTFSESSFLLFQKDGGQVLMRKS